MADRGMLRRTLPSAALAILLLAAALAVLRLPDPGEAARFFSGGVPTIQQGEAVVSLISWIVVAAIALFCIAGSLHALTRSDMVRQRSRRAMLIFVGGLLLLLVAVVQRSLPVHVDMCCGNTSAAVQQAAGVER